MLSLAADLEATRSRLTEPKPRRQWSDDEILAALRRWAALHAGLAPSRAEWTSNPDWPSAETVNARFLPRAVEAGARREVRTPCDCPPVVLRCGEPLYTEPYVSEARVDMGCPEGFCTGHEEPLHGPDSSRHWAWEGLSGWQFAIELAGLEVRRTAATASERSRFGRNRQMVTGDGLSDRLPGSVKHFDI